MEPVRKISGPVEVLDRSDVDTDQIIPKQFLKRIERAGYGEFLFFDWMKDPAFELHAYPGASIMIAGRNFGCGSSREHAVWALVDHRFRAVIAPSFGDIFAGNALKNGLLPIVLPRAVVQRILDAALATPGAHAVVDLATQMVTAPDGATHRFDIDARSKHCLLQGIDEIDYTLTQIDKIRAFERSLSSPGSAP